MKKSISVLIIAVVTLLIFDVYINKDEVTTNNDGEVRADRIASVLNDAWDEYGLFSFGIGDTDPVISIGMDETKNEQELREYLEENISKSDLSHYTIEIFKKDIEELEKEHTMSLIEGIVFAATSSVDIQWKLVLLLVGGFKKKEPSALLTII